MIKQGNILIQKQEKINVFHNLDVMLNKVATNNS